MKDRELTGKPMKDFFDCTTSPSTILAVIYRALAKRIERHRIEGRAERCLDVVRRKDFTDDARKKSRCELKKYLKMEKTLSWKFQRGIPALSSRSVPNCLIHTVEDTSSRGTKISGHKRNLTLQLIDSTQ